MQADLRAHDQMPAVLPPALSAMRARAKTATMVLWTATALLLCCAGCSTIDPYQREGTWRPRGVNDGNLAATIADPSNLTVGRQATSSDGLLAAAAIDRLHRDKVKALPSTDFKVGGGGSSSGGSDATGALTGGN